MSRLSKQTRPKRRLTLGFWKWVGYLSAAVTVVVVAFQLGQYWGYRVAKKDEFRTFVSYLAQIKDGVAITMLSSNKQKLSLCEVCEISVTIQNGNPFECELWLGASIRASDKTEYWNASEDLTITIAASGFTSLNRFLTIPANATPGVYDLVVNLWHGKISDPIHSERISSAVLSKGLIIVSKP